LLVDSQLFYTELQAITPRIQQLSMNQCLTAASSLHSKSVKPTLPRPTRKSDRNRQTKQRYHPWETRGDAKHQTSDSSSRAAERSLYQGRTQQLYLAIQTLVQRQLVHGMWSGGSDKPQRGLLDNEIKSRLYMLEQIIVGLHVVQHRGFLCLRLHSINTVFTVQGVLVLMLCFRVVRIVCRPLHPSYDSHGRIHRLLVACHRRVLGK
jgi:hypothetical protein